MQALLEKIHAVVGDAGLLTGEAVRMRPDNWPPTGGCQADAIVRPASTREVSEVLKSCHEENQPVVAHGGLTGLVRGAQARPGEIVLSLERMRKIERVNVLNRTMTVEAGVPLQSVHEAADGAGMLFPLDLGARGSATIGGNIATNAGGNSVIRYGMMRDQVLGLEAVLADGTVISSMNTVIKNNTGYDLKQLFIGSEGTLGIVTRAVLRLRPQMQSGSTALVALNGFEQVAKLLHLMDSDLGGTLSSFEVMWNDFYALITGHNPAHGLPLPDTFPFYVLMEANGSHDDIDRLRFERALEGALESELIVDAVIAQSEQQRNDLWAIRDDIEGLVHALDPPITFDVSLGIADMDGYVLGVRKSISDQIPDARLVVFGHIGDGNIHLVVGAGDLEDTTVELVENLVYAPLEHCGGVISAEHGIGLQKRKYLPISRSAEEIALMKSLKQTLDPKGLLNPGKIFEV